MEVSELKRLAAEEAVKAVQSNMVVGLGHGSTAIWATRGIASLLSQGALSGIVGIPCSEAVADEARTLGIPLGDLAQHPQVALTIDGADEVDPDLNLIKGGGGALLREKIVAQASAREIIIVDQSKLSPALGTRFALPVEVVPFGWTSQAEYIKSLGAEVSLRRDQAQQPFLSDQGNYILDCDFGPMDDPARIDQALNRRVGVVEHGLFLGLASEVIVASPEGIRRLGAG